METLTVEQIEALWKLIEPRRDYIDYITLMRNYDADHDGNLMSVEIGARNAHSSHPDDGPWSEEYWLGRDGGLIKREKGN